VQKKHQRELELYPIKNAIEKVVQLVSDSLIREDTQKVYLKRLAKIDLQLFSYAYRTSEDKITHKDLKYIICFNADMDTKDISLIFNIEPASVNTVRYRIKKKDSKFRAFL
jgi:hypothetical protein